MQVPSRRFKDSVYEQFARVGKAVASPRRLELLDLLCQGPRTVEELARQAGQSLANTSHHLQVLRAAQLVDAERDGLFVTYRLADAEVYSFFGALRGMAESRLAEVEQVRRQFLESRGAMEPIERAELLDRVSRGEVTVLDVRPVEEYLAGHIPGAVSVPLGELAGYLDQLPKDREVVAYCRGPYCVLALDAVDLLSDHGFRATRLEDGIAEWRGAGLKVATGVGRCPSRHRLGHWSSSTTGPTERSAATTVCVWPGRSPSGRPRRSGRFSSGTRRRAPRRARRCRRVTTTSS